jgi:hypothetical protein
LSDSGHHLSVDASREGEKMKIIIDISEFMHYYIYMNIKIETIEEEP